MLYKDAIRLLSEEYGEAQEQHGPFTTNHHGYAVILEEMDELWDVIKQKHASNEDLKGEAKQVAAMATRFLVDLCE